MISAGSRLNHEPEFLRARADNFAQGGVDAVQHGAGARIWERERAVALFVAPHWITGLLIVAPSPDLMGEEQ